MEYSNYGNSLVYVALFGWIPFIIGLFAILPPRRAVIYGFLAAWLFLPMAHIAVPGFTDYNKMSAACFGVLISALIFDSGTLFAFRPTVWDIPMFIWCICPCFSSLTNGLGFYDGLAAIAYQTTFWGLPYLIGRIYFNDLRGLRELAMGIVVGGLIYVPLCWYEIRFSPQLHKMVYGFFQYDFSQSEREGGYRPMVFMQHGLAVGLWMGATTICAFCIYRSKLVREMWGIPMGLLFFILLLTSICCRSTGATVLMLGGLAVAALTFWTHRKVFLILLTLAPIVYMVARGTGIWTGEDLIAEIRHYDTGRADSLQIRLTSERFFVDKAMRQPLFGWAGWNRFRETDENGNELGVPDALWIIALGHHGLVGLCSLTASLLLPIPLLMWKIPVRYWMHPGVAPAAALAIICGIYMCDNLLNAMINPIFVLGAGGICGLAFTLRQPHAAVFRAHPARQMTHAQPHSPIPVRKTPVGA
jgi:hypothetical protein